MYQDSQRSATNVEVQTAHRRAPEPQSTVLHSTENTTVKCALQKLTMLLLIYDTSN